MRNIILLVALYINGWAAWQMFSDGKDTYIYNNGTGEIYIRVDMGQENFKDRFVKMAPGQSAENLSIPTKEIPIKLTPTSGGGTSGKNYTDEELKKMQDEAAKMQSTILESVIKE